MANAAPSLWSSEYQIAAPVDFEMIKNGTSRLTEANGISMSTVIIDRYQNGTADSKAAKASVEQLRLSCWPEIIEHFFDDNQRSVLVTRPIIQVVVDPVGIWNAGATSPFQCYL